MKERLASDRPLIVIIAATQTIGWGTLQTPFPLLIAPLETELGFSRVLLNAGFTGGLLVSGLAAIPVGRWLDRHGATAMMGSGGAAAAVLLLALSEVQDAVAYVAIWLLLGLAQAAFLWNPAMAVVVALARDPTRSITAITFITGLTGTLFLPLTEGLINGLGWRGALKALALLQFGAASLTYLYLRRTPPPTPPRHARPRGQWWRKLQQPAFLGLAICFAAHAFIATGLAAHLIPLLRERGWPDALVLLLAAAHGPIQVTARAVLYLVGQRATMRSTGLFATALLLPAMIALGLAQQEAGLIVLFVLAFAIADGLLTIVRAAGPAEIFGREGYGAISGALAAVTVLPRTLAPLLFALLWQKAGDYRPLPWLLAAIALVAVAAFSLASRRVPPRHG